MDLAVKSWEKGGGAASDDCDTVALTEVGFPGSRWTVLFCWAVAGQSQGLDARIGDLKFQSYVRMTMNAKIAKVNWTSRSPQPQAPPVRQQSMACIQGRDSIVEKVPPSTQKAAVCAVAREPPRLSKKRGMS